MLEDDNTTTNPVESMVQDGARSLFPTFDQGDDGNENVDEEPTAEAKKIYDLLDSAKRPLWDGCTSGTELSVTAKYITMKPKFNLTEAAFTAVVQTAK